MNALAPDLLPLAAWMLVVIGGAFVSILAYGGKLLLNRLDTQDETLAAIRDLLASEVKTLREMHHDIDLRVTKIETACSYMHGPLDQHRRTTDG